MSKFSVGFRDVLYETKRAGDSRLHNSVECWRIKEDGRIIGYIKNRDQAYAIVDVLNNPAHYNEMEKGNNNG